MWIVDDICAKIGTANCSRRSYTHDSEIDLVIVDGAVSNGARRFAKEFRMELWGEHLEMKGASNARLEDYKLALEFWKTAGQVGNGRVRRYDENADTVGITDTLWNQVDPDGR